MPDVDTFIRVMRERDIPPPMWTNDQVYPIYLEHMDRKATPTKQAEITINTLFNIAEDHDIDVGSVFDHVTANEVILLLRQRRMSPWLLLHSAKFKQFFVHGTSSEEKIIMESIIRPPYWSEKFSTRSDDVATMKQFIQELNL
jgi:hypothetical protein